MEKHLEHFQPSRLKILYKTLFFFTIASGSIIYIQSSFLKELIGEERIGMFFSLAGFLTVLALFLFPNIVRRFGKRRVIISLLVVLTGSLIVLAFGQPILKLFAFLIYFMFLTLVGVNLDLFIEASSKDVVTGRIRGLAYTSMNVAWVITPALAGWLASGFGFSFLFLFAGLIFFSFILVFKTKFKNKKDEFNHPPPLLSILNSIFRSPALSKIFLISFLLTFFYSWMVIYTPMHLRSLGFEWWEIGRIFSVMLLPFLLLQYPAGWLADKFLGEKELMTTGIIILSVSTASLFWLSSTIAWPWMLLLFSTRIGAALIEIMRDTYFYKQIDLRDVHIISLFRNTVPLAYLIAPLIATLILKFYPLPTLFLVLGFISLLGLFPALSLKDTK